MKTFLKEMPSNWRFGPNTWTEITCYLLTFFGGKEAGAAGEIRLEPHTNVPVCALVDVIKSTFSCRFRVISYSFINFNSTWLFLSILLTHSLTRYNRGEKITSTFFSFHIYNKFAERQKKRKKRISFTVSCRCWRFVLVSSPLSRSLWCDVMCGAVMLCALAGDSRWYFLLLVMLLVHAFPSTIRCLTLVRPFRRKKIVVVQQNFTTTFLCVTYYSSFFFVFLRFYIS